jgi:glycosyltransferase involved in cell wall biosynthesis
MKKTPDVRKVTVIIQVGNLGGSVIDHLLSPIASAPNVKAVLVLCHNPGPDIARIQYRCPPLAIRKFAILSAIYEFLNLFRLSLFRRSAYLAGCLLVPHGLVTFVVAKLTGKKVIISLIGGRPELYTKGSVQGIDFNTTRVPRLGRLLLAMLRRSDAVITTGSVTKAFLVRHGVREERVHPIISPANKERFRQLPLPKLFDVVSVGYLLSIKHHDVFLKAISVVKKDHPNVKACIVGDGPRFTELVGLAKDLGIEGNVSFAGHQKDVPYYMNSSRVFVHSSEREGFPNVYLEAMSCGLPSVVSNCGDIIDVARDGQNSFVIQRFDDHEGFARAISLLLDDRDTYERMSKSALASMNTLLHADVTSKWELILGNFTSSRPK